MPDPNELDTLMAAKAELTVEQCALALENTIDVHTPLNEKRHILTCIETVRAVAQKGDAHADRKQN